MPGGFQEHPVLRVHELGLQGRQTKERRGKLIYVLDKPTPAQHIAPRLIGIVLPAPTGRWGFADQVGAVLQMLPETVQLIGPGKHPGHAHDRDRLIERVAHRGLLHAARRSRQPEALQPLAGSAVAIEIRRRTLH
ncbi:hypothetical protein D3C84_430160 [compost metagenome]